MIPVLLLLAALEPAPSKTPDDVLEQRMVAARVGAAVAFVVLVGGLAYGARRLSHAAKRAEEKERLEAAFREIDDDLHRGDR